MAPLTPAGQQMVDDIAGRHDFSPDAVRAMLDAVASGSGGMAQFSHPEFGGSGQWMRGGMTMIGDMFNSQLKGRIVALCDDLAALVAREPGLVATGGLFVGGGDNWWPSGLGSPSSTGAQNGARYAYFAQAHRLAIEVGGRVTVYDTLDHRISGFSQQQGPGGSSTFTSQHGLVDVGGLPEVSGKGGSSRQSQPAVPGSGSDVFATIEKLAGLHAKGILSDDEFHAKKAELLGRL